MTDAFKPHVSDSLLDWAASLLFAGLVGYACWLVGGAKLAATGAAAGFMVGAGLLAKVAPTASALASFDLQPLETQEADEGELLLDDALMAPSEGSRVVALFAAGESSPAALVARIEDYLGRDGNGRTALPAAPDGPMPMVDASAALHSALSNIRASLR